MTRQTIFVHDSLKELIEWRTQNSRIQKKIFELIERVDNTHFDGLGKPEPLKYNFKGKWSRRIDEEHRLIYEVNDKAIIIYSCKGHYE